MKSATRAWFSLSSLSQRVPELAGWQQQPDLLQLHLEEANGNLERFVQQALPLIAQQLPSKHREHLESSKGLKKLQRKGYSNGEIAEAFLYAWLAGEDTLYLPDRGWNLIQYPWVRIGVPVGMVSLTALVATEVWIHFNPRAAGMIFFGYALMAIPAVPIGWVYYKLWNGLLKRWYREPDNVMQQHPQYPQAKAAVDGGC
ncbi:hypothetical protein GLV89_13545 [Halomonas alkaliantarctica]|nr:hypothetical protein [Halomonas alkaliantarctica]